MTIIPHNSIRKNRPALIKNIFFKKRLQPTLSSIKGGLKYDTRYEKQVYSSFLNLKTKKFRSILLYFCLDIEATKISKITNISEGTLCKIFKQIRILIAKECEKISKMQGEIEIDESYFLLRFTRNCKQKGQSMD